jgi:hypothetical protein
MAYQLDERTDYAELPERVRRLELELEELWARCDVRLARLEALEERHTPSADCRFDRKGSRTFPQKRNRSVARPLRATHQIARLSCQFGLTRRPLSA